ncbi:MAG: Asp23/Gls24 family envelope stress response protein [Thermoactinomyces sp.]
MADQRNEGTVRIADDVVAVIAGLAASKTKGISSMSGGMAEGFARRVSGKNVTRGVHVEVGNLEAAIDLKVIVEYGEKIHNVCRELQKNVKEAVETMTGLSVVEVNVKVEGVALKESAGENAEAQRVR